MIHTIDLIGRFIDAVLIVVVVLLAATAILIKE